MRRSWRQTAFPIFLAPASWTAGLSLTCIGLVRRDPLTFDFLRSSIFVRARARNRGATMPDGNRDAYAPIYERAAVTNGPPSITLNRLARSLCIKCATISFEGLLPKGAFSPKPFATSLCIWRVIRRRTPCRQQPQAFPECFRRELRFWPVHQLSRSGWSLTIFE